MARAAIRRCRRSPMARCGSVRDLTWTAPILRCGGSGVAHIRQRGFAATAGRIRVPSSQLHLAEQIVAWFHSVEPWGRQMNCGRGGSGSAWHLRRSRWAAARLAADLPLKAPPKAVDFNPFWAEADYLAWSVTGDKLPALVTTAPVGTPLAVAGVLGQPTTTVLFGNSSVNNGLALGRAHHRRILVRSAAQKRHRGVVLRAGEYRHRLCHRHQRASDPDTAVPGCHDRCSERIARSRLPRHRHRQLQCERDFTPPRRRRALSPGYRPMERTAHQRADRLSLSALLRYAVDH